MLEYSDIKLSLECPLLRAVAYSGPFLLPHSLSAPLNNYKGWLVDRFAGVLVDGFVSALFGESVSGSFVVYWWIWR